jgi:hypothetical protein
MPGKHILLDTDTHYGIFFEALCKVFPRSCGAPPVPAAAPQCQQQQYSRLPLSTLSAP